MGIFSTINPFSISVQNLSHCREHFLFYDSSDMIIYKHKTCFQKATVN
jgi:hypothetical protein